MHIKRVSLARTILLWIGAAAGFALLSGCASLDLANLTPTSLPENPSEIYTFTLRVTPKNHVVERNSIAPHIVVDGKIYEMKKDTSVQNMYTFEYQLPTGRNEVAYYFLVNYMVDGNGGPTPGEANTEVIHSQILHRYVLSLEVNRGPIGATVGILGRGFTPQDIVNFNGTPVRTVYSSPTSLSFFVPAMTPGQNYDVSLAGTSGSSPVGTFRIDATTLTVNPTSLTLRSGETQNLSFSVPNAAPSGGLLLDVATDVPESVIMPEVVIPAGQTSVDIPVEGGKPGTGNLVLKGYGADVTIPVTVTGR